MSKKPTAADVIEKLARECERQSIEIEELRARIAELEDEIAKISNQKEVAL